MQHIKILMIVVNQKTLNLHYVSTCLSKLIHNTDTLFIFVIIKIKCTQINKIKLFKLLVFAFTEVK